LFAEPGKAQIVLGLASVFVLVVLAFLEDLQGLLKNVVIT
jgi:hypothetical protein